VEILLFAEELKDFTDNELEIPKPMHMPLLVIVIYVALMYT